MFITKHSIEERRELIINGNILYTLLLLSIPTLLVGVIQALIPLSDNLFLNNIAGTTIAGAISYCQPIINIMLALSQGLGIALMSIIGHHYGKGNIKKVKEISLQSFIFSFFIGIILIPICILLAFLISKYTTTKISSYVFTYIAFYSLVMPFIFFASTFNSIKNATGNPEVTFIRILALLILKVLFNTLFLVFFNMGVIGSVMATLFSYILITIWVYYDIFIKEDIMKLNIHSYKINFSIITQLIKTGFPSMLSYMLVFFGFFLINKEVEAFGLVALSGQAIASNVNGICFILPSSIATTTTSMISINLGINNVKKSKKIFNLGCIISIIIAIFTIILIIPNAEFYSKLFTREKNVLEIANNALHIYTYSVIGFGVYMVSQGVFIALGRTKITLFMSILRIWFLRYLFILITKNFLQVYSIFWGNLFSNTVAAIIFLILIKNINWGKIKNRI